MPFPAKWVSASPLSASLGSKIKKQTHLLGFGRHRQSDIRIPSRIVIMKRKGGGSERAEVDEENMDLERGCSGGGIIPIREQDREGLC